MEAPHAAFVVSIVCSACQGAIRLGDGRCPSCGKAVTAAEKRALDARWRASDPETRHLESEVDAGRVSLLFVAGLCGLQAAIYGLVGESTLDLVTCLAAAAVMLALFLLGRSWTLAAMVAGLTIYLGIQLITVLIDPGAALQGLVIRALVIVALFTGIGAQLTLLRRRARASRGG